MYIAYDDILEAVGSPPKWWSFGVPRFKPFNPADVNVYAEEVALVHTECQACGTRYDVAMVGAVRAKIAFNNALDVGDPPNACSPPGCPGAHMLSEEIKVLEYWHRPGLIDWERDRKWERNLEGYEGPEGFPALSIFHQINGGESAKDFFQARQAGDVETMRRFLEDVECELVDDVIDMLERERRMNEARIRRSVKKVPASRIAMTMTKLLGYARGGSRR